MGLTPSELDSWPGSSSPLPRWPRRLRAPERRTLRTGRSTHGRLATPNEGSTSLTSPSLTVAVLTLAVLTFSVPTLALLTLAVPSLVTHPVLGLP